MPRSVWKVIEGSGVYYKRYWKEMETDGSIQKKPEA